MLQRRAGLNDVAADSATVENIELRGGLEGERSVGIVKRRPVSTVIRVNAQGRVALGASSTNEILGGAHGGLGALEIRALFVSGAHSLIRGHLSQRRVGFCIDDGKLLARRQADDPSQSQLVFGDLIVLRDQLLLLLL